MAATLTILSEYFAPEEAATAQLLTDLAVGLNDRFDVAVLTAYPYYHGEDIDVDVPKHEIVEGVDVTRLRSTRFHKERLSLRVVNWVSFLVFVTATLLWRRPNGAVLALSNPPILPFAAWIHKRITGTPYVYLIHDMYPDAPVALGVLDGDGLVARIWERAIRSVYGDADRIVVLGDSMKKRLVDKMGDDPDFDPEKITVIPNWADGDEIRPMPKEKNPFAAEHGTRERFTLVYSGNIGRYHELETAISAVARLESDPDRPDIQMLVIGEGARKEEHIERVERDDIENVRFLPFQPAERLPETLTCGDASLVGIVPEMEGFCVSSKLYSSLAAGMPVLAVVGEGDEVARVIRDCDCGFRIEPGDVSGAVEVLARWADQPEQLDRLGTAARRCFEERYRRNRALDTYADVVEGLLEGNDGVG